MCNEAYAYKEINKYKRILYADQIRQLKGQIKSGNPDGAIKGLHTILRKKWRDRNG